MLSEEACFHSFAEKADPSLPFRCELQSGSLMMKILGMETLQATSLPEFNY
jgi:hypothetical protein